MYKCTAKTHVHAPHSTLLTHTHKHSLSVIIYHKWNIQLLGNQIPRLLIHLVYLITMFCNTIYSSCIINYINQPLIRQLFLKATWWRCSTTLIPTTTLDSGKYFVHWSFRKIKMDFKLSHILLWFLNCLKTFALTSKWHTICGVLKGMWHLFRLYELYSLNVLYMEAEKRMHTLRCYQHKSFCSN